MRDAGVRIHQPEEREMIADSAPPGNPARRSFDRGSLREIIQHVGSPADWRRRRYIICATPMPKR